MLPNRPPQTPLQLREQLLLECSQIVFIANRRYSEDVIDDLKNKSLNFDLLTAYIALGSQKTRSFDGKMQKQNSAKWTWLTSKVTRVRAVQERLETTCQSSPRKIPWQGRNWSHWRKAGYGSAWEESWQVTLCLENYSTAVQSGHQFQYIRNRLIGSLRIQPPLIQIRYYVWNVKRNSLRFSHLVAGANERRLYSQASKLAETIRLFRNWRFVNEHIVVYSKHLFSDENRQVVFANYWLERLNLSKWNIEFVK